MRREAKNMYFLALAHEQLSICNGPYDQFTNSEESFFNENIVLAEVL